MGLPHMTIQIPRWRRRPCALAILSLFASLTHAQELLAQSTHVPRLHETVVTATRIEQPITDIVADVSIIDRDAIERAGATGVVDLLARLPGIEMVRNGGPANSSNLYVRGAEGRFTAVYVDGVRIDSQATGGVPWEQIPLSQIERIEVLRGPAAAVYGSDAIGGVVQLFTKKGEGPATPYVGLGLGSHRLRRLEAGLAGAAGEAQAFDYALGITREISDGYDIRDGENHDPDRDGHASTAAHVRLGWQATAAHRLEASLLAHHLDAGYDEFHFGPPATSDDRSLDRLRTAGLTWSARWSSAWRSRLTVNESLSRHETTPVPYRTETRLRNLLWHHEYRSGNHLFSAALERREDRLRNPALDAFSVALDRGRSQDGLALGYGYNAGGHTVQLQLRHDEDSEFGGKATGSAAWGYALTPRWRVTASVATAFRAPTLYQRFSAYGDASLKPEESRNIELGLRYANGRTQASVVAYRNRVRHLIVFDSGATACGAAFGCYNSIGRAQYQGVTVAAGHRIGATTLRASLDWNDAKDPDTGRWLPRRARHHATLGADTMLAGWTFGAEVIASGRRFENAANSEVLGGYALVNVHVSRPIGREFALLARIDNLGDKDYRLAQAYLPPGRTLYVGLRWTPRP
jgi:vitamin B12 transporter